MPKYRLTVDTGGTFSDFVLLNEETREHRVLKVPSTPDDPGRAILDGLDVLAKDGVKASDIVFFCHGTTIATNALLEEKGATVGLVGTKGFRGIYETQEQSRPYGPAVFDLQYTRPPLLAPGRRTAEVTERMGADGEPRIDLDESSIDQVIARFESEGVESVAVSLLFSFMNDEHERRVRDRITAAHPAAAYLFYTWILTDGQEVLREAGLRSSLQEDAESAHDVETIVVDTDRLVEEYDFYADKYAEVIGR